MVIREEIKKLIWHLTLKSAHKLVFTRINEADMAEILDELSEKQAVQNAN